MQWRLCELRDSCAGVALGVYFFTFRVSCYSPYPLFAFFLYFNTTSSPPAPSMCWKSPLLCFSPSLHVSGNLQYTKRVFNTVEAKALNPSPTPPIWFDAVENRFLVDEIVLIRSICCNSNRICDAVDLKVPGRQ